MTPSPSGMFIVEGLGKPEMESQQADKRIEGLKVLARMIAADYKRRQRAARARNSQPANNVETPQKLTTEEERQR